MNQAYAKFILPEMNKLSAVEASSLGILFISCGMPYMFLQILFAPKQFSVEDGNYFCGYLFIYFFS